MASNNNVIYISLKSTFSGLQFFPWQYGAMFIRLAIDASQTARLRGIPGEFELSSSRSSKSSTMVSKNRLVCFLHRSFVWWSPRHGNPLEFQDETYRIVDTKTRGVELLYGENCTVHNVFTDTPWDWWTDGQRDGRAIAYTVVRSA